MDKYFSQYSLLFKRIIPALFLVVSVLQPWINAFAATATPKEVSLDAETDLTISVYPARGPYRILWVPGYATPLDTVDNIATQLVKLNTEVWHVDLLDARFLPKTASNIYKIQEQDLTTVIQEAIENTNKKLFVYAESRSVIPVLLALRQMQRSAQGLRNFGGLILNSPYFYVETPEPGIDPQLMPVVSATNLPVYILQPKNSPRYWQLKQTVPALEKSGSDVFIQILSDIRGRFHFRPDATVVENALTEKAGNLLIQAINHLETINHKSRTLDTQETKAVRNAGHKKDRQLQVYKGDPQPPELKLENLAGQTVDLESFEQKVVLVNFWASWCPPCVEEMPSMQRLSNKLAKDRFLILGVNIAESQSIVEKFLTDQVKINFPILLDLDGSVMRQWNVMAFPTSFVVDKRGKIRYALFGSIDWDTPDIINTFQTLIDE